MKIEEISQLLTLLGSFGAGGVIGAALIYLFIKSYIPSYLTEKGKNLATKEDIAAITNKVESIKTDYAKVLEEIRSNNQLNLAEIEREKNIRKEVYLEAVEAITRTINIVANLSNLNINDEEITKQMANDSGQIAKVQIVGSESTVKAVTTFMGAIGTAILELMLDRGRLIQRKNNIDALENLRTRDQSKINDLHIIQYKEHMEFSKKCMNSFFEISELLPDVVLSVRNDLGLPISSDAYLDVFSKHQELGKRVFKELYERISKSQA